MTCEAQQTQYISQCNSALESAAERFLKKGSVVSEAARYSLMNGGKRVRGVLVQAASALLGGSPAAAAAFAAAIEMIHAFSLIHDDLPCMDDDPLRRGKPACHIRYGEANALLAGDLLTLEAFNVLMSADIDASARVEAARVLSTAAGAHGMIYGQELDLYYEENPADVAALEAIEMHKTGALLVASVQLGVCATGQEPRQHPALTAYAQQVGRAFQIVDDVLDVQSTEDVLGKPIGSDAQQGKATFVSLLGVPKATEEVQRLTTEAIQTLEAAYGEDASFLSAFATQLAKRVV